MKWNSSLIIMFFFTIVHLFACHPDDDNFSAKITEATGISENDKDSLKNVGDIATMKIKIAIGKKALTAILNDNETAKDFASLLPLTITLEDYADTEKIYQLDKKLSTEGASSGYDPEVGDITYYAPWGNLAIFYKDFGYARGLVKLGHINESLEPLAVSGPVKVKIELVK